MSHSADPLLLGQRVVAILETGQRDATYKLATLMALIDHCIENLPADPEDVLHVPIPALAYRVLALYWQQRRTGTKARIADAAKSLRAATGSGNSALSLDIAMLRAPDQYQAAIDKITVVAPPTPPAGTARRRDRGEAPRYSRQRIPSLTPP